MVLIAEQNFQQAEVNLIQAQASRLADTAALYQALGGGWWNRKDEVSQTPQQVADSSTVHAAATATAEQTPNTTATTERLVP